MQVEIIKVHPVPSFSRRWILSAHGRESENSWEEDRKAVLSNRLSDVRGFWNVWNNVPWGLFENRSIDLQFFWSRSEPSWEHTSNCGGGRVVAQGPRSSSLAQAHQFRKQAILIFYRIAMALVGENMIEDGSALRGVVAAIRPRINGPPTRVSIWIGSCDLEKRIEIESWLRTAAGDDFSVFYIPHEAKIASNPLPIVSKPLLPTPPGLEVQWRSRKRTDLI